MAQSDPLGQATREIGASLTEAFATLSAGWHALVRAEREWRDDWADWMAVDEIRDARRREAA